MSGNGPSEYEYRGTQGAAGLKLLYQGEHTFAIEGIQSDMRLKFVFDGAQANWFLFYNNGYFTRLAKRQRYE
jgi:hypothetical protein